MRAGKPPPPASFRLLLLSAALGFAPTPAQPCDSSACLLVTRGYGVLEKGAVRFDLSFRQTDQNRLLRGSRATDVVLRPKVDFENRFLRPGYHNEFGGTERFLQLDVAYGLTSRVSLLASFPVFARREFEIGHPPVFQETYTTTGNGDVLLGMRYALTTAPFSHLVGGLSLKVPTGPHQLVSPRDRADVGILDPFIQPGTGSMDFVASLQYSRRTASIDWSLTSSYQANTRNDLGYRFGNDAIASVTASRMTLKRLSASLQMKAYHKGRSEFMGDSVPSTGTSVLYLTPGLSLSATKGVSLYGFAPVPVYLYVNEAQLAPRPGFLLGLSKTF